MSCFSSQASASASARIEPTLRVRVEHLDGLAVAIADHVSGLLRAAARQVVGRRHVAGDFDLRLQPSDRGHHSAHGGRARHVLLHRLHRPRRLQRQPSRVERDALADQGDAVLSPPARTIAHANEARLFDAAAIDGEKPVQSQAADRIEAHHLDPHRAAAAHRHRASRELRCRHHRRGLVDEVTRRAHRAQDHVEVAKLLRDRPAVQRRADQRRVGELRGPFLRRLAVAIEAVSTERDRLRRGRDFAGPRLGEENRCAPRTGTASGTGCPAECASPALERAIARLAHAGQIERAERSALLDAMEERLALLSAELGFLGVP